MQRALRGAGSPPWRLEQLILLLDQETPPQPLLDRAAESFGPLTEAVGECVVKPATIVLTGVYSVAVSAVTAVLGLCIGGWDARAEVAHDKRQ